MNIKPYLGLSILIFFGFIFPGFQMYSIYLGITQKKYVYLILNALQLIFQTFFAKKNEYYINLVKYFNILQYFNGFDTLIEEPIDKEKTLLCFHPHNIYSLGMIGNIHLKIQNFVLMGSRFALNIPFLGMMLKFWDVRGVNPASFKQLLNEGKNIAMVPGGFEEATITSHYQDRVYIKSRKGFIKYAIKYGYKIQVAYCFNERKCFYTFDKFVNFRLYLNKFKMVGVLYISKFGICPDPNVHIVTVIGKPIQCPKIENPSQDVIDQYHKKYIQTLEGIFQKYVIFISQIHLQIKKSKGHIQRQALNRLRFVNILNLMVQ